MPFVFSKRLYLPALTLILFHSAWAQTPPTPAISPSDSTSAARVLAAALAAATSEEEQERLLARETALNNDALLEALRDYIRVAMKKRDTDRALRLSQLAVRIAERSRDRKWLSEALGNLGVILLGQYRFAEASNNFQKSLAIAEETGDKQGMASALQYLGILDNRQSRFDQALERYNRALALSEETGNRNQAASILTDIARVHQSMGRNELSLEFLEKSRALSEELNDRRLLAIVLNNIAIQYLEQGRYMEALERLQKSVKLDEMAEGDNRMEIAIRLNNIGIIYKRQGRYDQALDYYRKSLELLEEIKDKGRIADAQNNIGVIYKSLGQYEQSLEWLRKSLKNSEETSSPRGIATSLNNIGDAFRRQGHYDLALPPLQKSLQIRESARDSLGTALTLNNLSRLYQDEGRYSEMLDVSRRAARLAEEINDPEGLWNAQNSLGMAFRALGQPAAARQSFLDAIATLESLRHQVAGGAQQQQSFLENKLSPWIGMINLLVDQHQYAEALSFAEQSKARVLIDALQAGRPRLYKSLSEQERRAEEQKRLRLVELNSQLTRELRRDKPDPSRVTEQRAAIARARLEFEALETSLYVAHPELKVDRGEASIIKTEELAALVPDATSAALEYVVADDRTFLFVITKANGKTTTEVRVYTLPIKRSDLTMKTEAFRRQLAGRDLGFRVSAAQLYALLLKTAEAQLKGKTNLVIVPDDKLWELPFQALTADGRRFLIENMAISYAPSLTVLREMTMRRKNQNTNAATGVLLALGNPVPGKRTIERATLGFRDEKIDRLPEAELEVKALGRMYGATRSKVYVGQQAREERVKNEAGRAAILHFATHGTLNNASPMYSHLVLAEGDTTEAKEAKEDGLLEAWELMRLDLKADLAVLSACETARGRFGGGEGMIGLTWALFVAGVPATVVSQWKVESASTRDLMLGFHRRLQAHQASGKSKASKAEALRHAAIALLRNPATSHPFYWAGFVLVGDGD